MTDLTIRAACPEDAAQLLEIYAPYVRETAISLEYAVPSREEFASRIRATLARYPYLVAEREGQPCGYTYAGPFKTRASYGWSVEASLYVLKSAHGLGLGRALYEALEACLREQGFTNVNACIACPVVADEYLTRNSIEFHAHMGYRLVGEFTQCACKFGRWYDMAWMEKLLLPHTPNPAVPRSFDDVREIVREKYGIA